MSEVKTRKINHVLEIIWIVLAILCLILGVYNSWFKGFANSYMFFILSFLAFLMYILRRNLRKRDQHQ